MSPALTTALGLVLLALGIGVLLVLTRRIRATLDRARPVHLGPDSTDVEAHLVQRLDRDRAAAGRDPLEPHPDLAELARHHAYWMSVNGMCTPRDDRGRDVQGRMRDLAPDLRMEVEQQQQRIDVEGIDEDRTAQRLRDAFGEESHWLAERWSHAGAGVAIGRGSVWGCTVVGRGDVDEDERMRDFS